MEDKSVQTYKPYTIDIESNGLLDTMLDYGSLPYKLNKEAKLWWVVVRDLNTGTVFKAAKENITKEWLRESLKGCTHLIAHNGLKFDFITLKLFGLLDYTVGYLNEQDTLFGEPVVLVDTLVLSRLLFPDRPNGHSLEAWGNKLGFPKIDFRKACIEAGIIEKTSPKGAEFLVFSDFMGTYCEGDTLVNAKIYEALMQEMQGGNWSLAIKLENKLADLAVRRENFGFHFDKDLALKCVEDLTLKMQELQDKVNPLLPLKDMTKGELAEFTPPKTQLTKDSLPSSFIKKFAERIGGEIVAGEDNKFAIKYKNKYYVLPIHEPLETQIAADINNLDHVKSTLISYGWNPTEWAERDFTKDSKKQLLPYEKRIKAFERWLDETMVQQKYIKHRLQIAFQEYNTKDISKLEDRIKEKLKEDFPVRLPTSPKVRVGIEKELCSNLIALGEKVEFAKDFALYLTYKHRKSSISGGEIDENDQPEKGYLSLYREADSRIPTPAIEIGAASNRYTHIGVANIARASSIYGKEMRSLFGAGKEGLQYGYDFSSIEGRIQGNYCWKYTGGEELAKTLIASKPNDIHTVTAGRLQLDRDSAKSINYMLLYGGKIGKIIKMLGCSKQRAQEIYDGFWASMPALKELKEAVEKFWDNNGQSFVPALDGRRIKTRSRHSLLNNIFQSGAVICAKYVNVLSMQFLEQRGFNIDVFKNAPDIANMIEYHDECQLFIKKNLVNFKTFQSEEEAKEFVKSWEGEGQLSSIGHGKVWYICLPNIVSEAVEYGIKETEKLLKLNVSLGYEWSVGKTWYDTH